MDGLVLNYLIDGTRMTTPNIEESKLDTNQLLLGALDNRWKNYRRELKRCRVEFSNEAVHDLRVATRRMLAFIQLLNSISPRPRLQKLIRAFKNQLNVFDDLRDTQVILAELSGIIHELPQLQDFQKHRAFIVVIITSLFTSVILKIFLR